MVAFSRFAARMVDGSWCYCAMGYDVDGVYGVAEVLVSGYATQVDVCVLAGELLAPKTAARKVG